MKLRPSILISLIVAIVLIGASGYWRYKYGALDIPLSENKTATKSGSQPDENTEFHTHSRLLIFLGGKQLDLSQLHYMERDEKVHMHDNDGTIVHVHAEGVTLPFFFNTLGMKLTSSCFVTDTKRTYCTDATSTLSVFINKKMRNEDIANYELRNYDKILINYGTDTPLDLQLKMNSLENLGNDY